MFGTSTTSKLRPSKVIEEKIKKKAFYVGNVEICEKDAIESHLTENGIKFNNVFSVFKNRSKDTTDKRNSANNEDSQAEVKPTKSTAFKIIVPECEVSKLLNGNIWNSSTFLYEWIFKQPTNLKPSTNHV